MPAAASGSPYPASPVSRRRSACGPVRSLSAGIPTPPPPVRTRSGAHARCRKLPASRFGRDPPRRLYGPPAPRSRRPASPRRRLPPRSLLLGKRPGLIRARRRLRTSLKTNPPRGTTTPATAPVAAGAGAEGRRGTQKKGSVCLPSVRHRRSRVCKTPGKRAAALRAEEAAGSGRINLAPLSSARRAASLCRGFYTHGYAHGRVIYQRGTDRE